MRGALEMFQIDSHKVLAAVGIVMAGVLLSGCAAGGETLAQAAGSEYDKPVVVGRIETPEIAESSGLSASECQDVLWTHNDAGNGPFIYAMDTRGKHLGTWRVENARSTDWESIATYKDTSGKCHLLIGDIGDNDEARAELEIYRIPEPAIVPEGKTSTSANPLATAPADVLRFAYADGRNNAETLLVHPATGDIYVVTKEKTGPAGVHRIKPAFGSAEVLKTERIAEIAVPSKPEGLVTGGSLSPDGRRLMLCDRKGGYEFTLPAGTADPNAIWTQKPTPVDLGDRKQGEGVSYAPDGQTLYASSEKKNAPLFMIKRRA